MPIFKGKKITWLKGFAGAKKLNLRGLFKNPSFYFGLLPFVLLGTLFFASSSLGKLSYFKDGSGLYNSFFNDDNLSGDINLFFGQNKILALETPDLKIIEDNFIYGISTPRVLTTQTLGDILGESPSNHNKEIIDYTVQPGDTIESVAIEFKKTPYTIYVNNNLSKGSALKVGQNLIILPVDGVLHIVKPGDTISQIAKTYKAETEDIIAFNDLANELDIFIGDILIIPDGIMPPKPAPSTKAPLPDSFFIYPTEGIITQGLHYYNAVDAANKCGTSIHAAASGVVQRVRYDYRYGNYLTILHSNGVVTYYGHLQTIFVKSGDNVTVGDKIASMGNTGTRSTGCHLHFGVSGDRNPLAKFLRGSFIKYR